MATDIALVVGCLALLGGRIPVSLRIMLLSLAIADDIGAILVIGMLVLLLALPKAGPASKTGASGR
jgi:Na+/H+ antiporter NhaA